MKKEKVSNDFNNLKREVLALKRINNYLMIGLFAIIIYLIFSGVNEKSKSYTFDKLYQKKLSLEIMKTMTEL